jgi:VWFA-related protein
LSQWFVAGILATMLLGQQQSGQQQQAPVPDAPKPQAEQLQGLPAGAMTPGTGTNPDASQNAGPGQAGQGQAQTPPANGQNQIPAGGGQPQSGQAGASDDNLPAGAQQQAAPQIGAPGKDEEQIYKIRRVVNFVVVPVQVRDKQNQLVGGLTWRDFEVYEDNRRQRLVFFSADAVPVSAALVIDQSLTSDVEAKVNEALRAISGAFSPYDEVAVFTYANGATQQTGFTAALGDRLPAVLAQNQGKGRDMGAPISSGPLASGPTINGQPVDPNLNPYRGTTIPVIPKEIHTLNDAVFAAAKVLAHTEPERRRIIYVISDGREQGSKVSQKEVERFLLTNNIGVYGTLVGESAVWGLGYLDKIHLPLLPRNNILPKYAATTGGTLDSEVSRDGIERSFARVTEAARTEYTLGYNSPIPATSPAYRKIEVRVNRPGLTIVSKDGYYPTPVKQE